MAEKHAGACEAHDLVHLRALVPRVAVDRAIPARGLLFAVRALEEPVARVVEEGFAARAQLALARANVEEVRRAPDVEHRLDRALLPPEARRHEKSVLVFLRDRAHGEMLPEGALPVADADASRLP